MADLGRLTRIDARKVWTREDYDFTPWLKENISLLGEALGLDLDLVESEVRVGTFAADLVAKDVSHNRWVVIENQLEATDHSHLGQLLTYGAGLDNEAAVFVWISPDFRDEHRAALDWLNEHSDEESLFFGVVIELLKIDDSSPAPNFRLVSYPNNWKKSGGSARTPTSQKAAAYQEFFAAVLQAFKAQFPGETNVSKASHDSWLSMSIGRSGLSTGWAFTIDKRFRVELYIDSGDVEINDSYFNQLDGQRAVVERAVGEALDWDRLQGKRACRISLYHPDSPLSVLDDAAKLAQLQEWAASKMKTLRDAFRPHIQELHEDVSPSEEP